MFSFLAIQAVAAQVVAHTEIQKSWQQKFDSASPEIKQVMLAEQERRRIYALEERRHRETVDAIKQSQSSSGFGMGFIWGMILGNHN